MMAALTDRISPQSIEAEQSVLGAILLDKDALVKAMEDLKAEDFYKESHKLILRAASELYNRGEAVDLVTVVEQLRKEGTLEAAGGVTYLAELVESVPTPSNVDYYIKIVQEKAILRRLLAAANKIINQVYESKEETESLLDAAEQLIFNVCQEAHPQRYYSLKDVLIETFQNIEELYLNKGRPIGIPTGFQELDELLSGMHPSELIILAARPSQGKSTLGMNVACNVAIDYGIPVAFFSLEMAKEQVAQRMLCAEAQVNSQRLRTGYLTDDDWPRLSRALGRLSEAPIFIDDTPNLSIMEVRSRARRLKAERNIGLVIIDYLQLMHIKGRAENRQQEISEITRSLKALARELQAPIVVLSQLSRAVEQRQDRRPQLSDLRESGAIEQDADVVAFIYHNPETEHKNIVELIVAKQRNGPTGSVELVFLKETGRFVSLERRQRQ